MIPPVSADLLDILAKALTDDPFRAKLIRDPDDAIGGYKLNPGEREILAGIEPGLLDGFAAQVRSGTGIANAMVMVAAVGRLPE
jgi:hypothetical protein